MSAVIVKYRKELLRIIDRSLLRFEKKQEGKMNKVNNLPSKDVIYISTCTPEKIYGYVRAFRGGEVGFSVLDVATSKPDFSNCGVFWVKPEDFMRTFKFYLPKKFAPGIC